MPNGRLRFQLQDKTDQEEREVLRIQHALMKAFPQVVVADTSFVVRAARTLAVELWRDGVRAVPC